MNRVCISLGSDIDLTIHEPVNASASSRAMIVASAIKQEFQGVSVLGPSTRVGYLALTLGSEVLRVYYEMQVKRVLNDLAAYSQAIRYIETHSQQYDRRLAVAAINRLRECFKEDWK